MGLQKIYKTNNFKANIIKLFIVIIFIGTNYNLVADDPTQNEIDRDIWRKYILSYKMTDGPMHVSFHNKDFVRIIPRFDKIQTAKSYFPHVLDWMSKAKSKKMKFSIDFRFLKRISQEQIAFETVIYKYQQINDKGVPTDAYGKFNAIHRKVNGKWQLAMDLNMGKIKKTVWDNAKLHLTDIK